MDLEKQFIEDNGLTAEQVTALNTNIATQETGWESKANENAEGILSGASTYAQKKAGVELSRNDGEKYGDYLNRIGDASISGKSTAIEKLEGEWNTKLKDFKGNEALTTENETLKNSMSIFKEKSAKYDVFIEGDIENKLLNSTKELSTLKRNLAFQSAKPNFPDSANEFEVKAKWNEFVNDVESKYDIHLDENNKPILKDKENDFKIVTLQSLVEKDKNISELIKGTKIPGLNTKPSTKSVEGVPFKISDDMTSKDRQTKIKEYLTKERGLSITSGQYAKEFSDLNQKLMEKTPK